MEYISDDVVFAYHERRVMHFPKNRFARLCTSPDGEVHLVFFDLDKWKKAMLIDATSLIIASIPSADHIRIDEIDITFPIS